MNLQLSLKKTWWDMSDTPDSKTEDYREITPYWAYRLLNKQDKHGFKIESIHFWIGFLSHSENNKRVFKFRDQSKVDYVKEYYGFKDFKTNIMTLGYPKKDDTSRIKIFEHAGIEIRTGNHEWGAEPNKLYFVIKHGKRIQ